jgi:hypothetical protein
MTMFYSNADLAYVESKRVRREEADSLKGQPSAFVKGPDGVYRDPKLGETKGVFGK